MNQFTSLDVTKAAVKVAMTSSRNEEDQLVKQLKEHGINATAVDVGGNLIQSIPKIIERAIIASRKTGITKDGFRWCSSRCCQRCDHASVDESKWIKCWWKDCNCTSS